MNLDVLMVLLFACLALCFSAWVYLGGGAFEIEMMAYRIGYAVEKFKFRLKRWLISLLPDWAIEEATIQLIAHATCGKYGNTDVSELRAMTALRRWSKK